MARAGVRAGPAVPVGTDKGRHGVSSAAKFAHTPGVLPLSYFMWGVFYCMRDGVAGSDAALAFASPAMTVGDDGIE